MSNNEKDDPLWNTILQALRAERAARKQREKLVNPVTKYRDDGVFEEGVDWLDGLAGDETFGPMRSPDFDFKKHYIRLMENYKAALWKIDELESELDKFRNGYQGGCYACEIVGEKNVALEAENKRLREAAQAVVHYLSYKDDDEGLLYVEVGLEQLYALAALLEGE